MATNTVLEARWDGGALVGFANMAAKESGTWWRRRRGLSHMLLWLVVINGFIALVGIGEMEPGSYPERVLNELMMVFFQVGGLFATIGIIVSTQGSLLGERTSGTAEWVLSKPITRPAFVLSKLVVNGASFLLLAVLLPAVAFYVETPLLVYLQPDLGRFALALALHVEHLLFFLAFTLALGAFMDSRGAVAGAAVGLLFAGLILPNFFSWLNLVLPAGLPGMAATVATGGEVPEEWFVPVTLTAIWTWLAVRVALWRFAREEF